MNDERAELLRKTLNFPERNVARAVREYRPEDFEALKRMFRSQSIEYAFPDLSDPRFVTKVVLEDQDGEPVMAALGRLTCEAYLLVDRDAGNPREKYQRLVILEREALADAKARGLDSVEAQLPPQLAERFGRRLESLGWRPLREGWKQYCKRF